MRFNVTVNASIEDRYVIDAAVSTIDLLKRCPDGKNIQELKKVIYPLTDNSDITLEHLDAAIAGFAIVKGELAEMTRWITACRETPDNEIGPLTMSEQFVKEVETLYASKIKDVEDALSMLVRARGKVEEAKMIIHG